jgi:threonine aldolase
VSNDLWLKNAQHANDMAQFLAQEIKKIPEVTITQPIQTNAVFAIINPTLIPSLQEKYYFYVWNETTSEVRLMTSFDTTKEDIINFVTFIQEAL